jgi:hypothetical protein
MQYGICNLGIVPLRLEPSDTSEMVSQVLYGTHFKVLEQRKKWSRIRIAFDRYEGWIDNKQLLVISEEAYLNIGTQPNFISSNLLDYVTNDKQQLIPIPLGASLDNISLLNHKYEGELKAGPRGRSHILSTALLYLNSPYLWGGMTPFGIDCSGFTQMVYRICGFQLKRDASQQATQGEALSFIEESEPGDLAFFDNSEGQIVHVGIIMEDHYIIHAHGKVRIDRIDHSGIYNVDSNQHTHKLRVIKKIIP